MPGTVRIANADISFSANTAGYTRGTSQIIAANANVARSYGGLIAAGQRFTQSIQASLIATLAYAAGVNALRSLLQGSSRAFIENETGLTAVRKTADLTADETEILGRNFDRLLTSASALGRPLPVIRRQLLGIAEVAGQMNIQGTPAITAFTEAVALMTLTTDLDGRRAAEVLGILIANTDATAESTLGLVSAITRLGNINRGGEGAILALAQRLAQATGQFNLAAQDLLAVAATLGHAGLEPEISGTAVGRTFQSLQRAAVEAIQGDESRLREIARNLSDDYGSLDERIQLLLKTIRDGDFIGGLRFLLEAFSNAGEFGGNVINALFGSDPQRALRVIATLARHQERLGRNTRESRIEIVAQNAVIREAGLFAENTAARLVTVLERFRTQGIRLGGFLTAAFVDAAEAALDYQGALSGVGFALTAVLGARRVQAFRRGSAEILKQDRELQTKLLRSQTLQQDAIYRARQRISVGGFAAPRQLEQSRRTLIRETGALAKTQERLVVVNQSLNRVLSVGGRITRGLGLAYAALGGPVGIALLAVSGLAFWLSRVNEEASAARDELDGVIAAAERLIQQQNQSNLSATGIQIANLGEQRVKLIEREIDLLHQRENIENLLRNAGLGENIIQRELAAFDDRAFTPLANDIDRIDALLESLRKNLAAAGAAGTKAGNDIATSFERLDLSLETSATRVRDFGRDLLRQANRDKGDTRLELDLIGASKQQALILQQGSQIQRQLESRRQLSRDELEAASAQAGRAGELEKQAQAIAARHSLETAIGKQAQRQLAAAMKNRIQADKQLTIAEQRVAREQLLLPILEEELVARAALNAAESVRVQRLQEIHDAQSRPLSIGAVDDSGFRNLESSLRQRLEGVLQELDLGRRLADLGEVEIATTRAGDEFDTEVLIERTRLTEELGRTLANLEEIDRRVIQAKVAFSEAEGDDLDLIHDSIIALLGQTAALEDNQSALEGDLAVLVRHDDALAAVRESYVAAVKAQAEFTQGVRESAVEQRALEEGLRQRADLLNARVGPIFPEPAADVVGEEIQALQRQLEASRQETAARLESSGLSPVEIARRNDLLTRQVAVTERQNQLNDAAAVAGRKLAQAKRQLEAVETDLIAAENEGNESLRQRRVQLEAQVPILARAAANRVAEAEGYRGSIGQIRALNEALADEVAQRVAVTEAARFQADQQRREISYLRELSAARRAASIETGEAEKFLDNLRRQTVVRERDANQRRELAQLSDREAASRQAELEVLNNYQDQVYEFTQRQSQAEVRAEDARGRLADVTAELNLELTDNVKASQQLQLELEKQIQGHIAAALAAGLEVETLEKLLPLIQDIASGRGASAGANFLGPLERLRQEAEQIDVLLSAAQDGVDAFTARFVEAFGGPIADGIRTFSTEFADGLVEGNLKFDELIENMLKGIAKAVLQALILRAVFAGIGALGGGGIGQSGSLALIRHEGGTGSSGPPYRSLKSPLRAREKLAVILDDEEVLTSRDPRHRWNFRGSSFEAMQSWVSRLPKYHGGGMGGAQGGGRGSSAGGGGRELPVRVELINQGTPQEVTETKAFITEEDIVLRVVTKDLSRNGSITRVVQQMARG